MDVQQHETATSRQTATFGAPPLEVFETIMQTRSASRAARQRIEAGDL
jgi:hypothetical protein